jgi:hypothetical protein
VIQGRLGSGIWLETDFQFLEMNSKPSKPISVDETS